MKKQFQNLVMLMMLVCWLALVFSVAAQDAPSGETISGFWTDEADVKWYDPTLLTFNLYTEQELAGLAKIVNEKKDLFAGKVVNLCADLDLTGHEWVAIGSYADGTGFKGVFDGQRHIIKGLRIQTDKEFQGLFGRVDGGGSVSNVSVLGALIQASSKAGGIVGSVDNGAIRNCYTSGDITGINAYFGGIAGEIYNDTKIINCASAMTIRGNRVGDDNRVGGIVGKMYRSLVEACYFSGTIANAGKESGGIVGESESSADVVANCFNRGTIGGEGRHVGGIIGYSRGAVSNCYNIGAVSGGADFKGALIGCDADPASLNEDNYFLAAGRALAGVGSEKGKDLSDQTGVMPITADEMKSDAFVNKLNEPVWSIEEGLNEGFPIPAVMRASVMVMASAAYPHRLTPTVMPFLPQLTEPDRNWATDPNGDNWYAKGIKKFMFYDGDAAWYAWGRAAEILGASLPEISLPSGRISFRGLPGTWWADNLELLDTKAGGFEYGNEPKEGALALWGSSATPPEEVDGHVAVVEKIDGDMLTVSESMWMKTYWTLREINKNDMGKSTDGSDFLGYIYLR